jgi:hypothetical protein
MCRGNERGCINLTILESGANREGQTVGYLMRVDCAMGQKEMCIAVHSIENVGEIRSSNNNKEDVFINYKVIIDNNFGCYN